MRKLSRRRWLVDVMFPAAAAWCYAPLTAQAAPRWVDIRGAGPFVCRADFRLRDYDALFGDLAQVQTDLHRVLGIEPAREQVELYLFADKSSYQQYLGRLFPQVPYRRALFIKGSGPGMVFAHRNDEFEIDIRHESTHALLHSALVDVPLWLDEGLAEYFELPRGRRATGSPHLKVLRWNSVLGWLPKLSSLERKRDLAEMGQAEYRYAWAWVHFMLHGPEPAHDELVHYLTTLRTHVPDQSLGERLESRLPRLESRLARHFAEWTSRSTVA